MARQIFAIQGAETCTIFVKKNNEFVVHMRGSTKEVCNESRKLNEYGRTHRITQEIGNLILLSSLDTNKTKESIKM